MRTSYSALVDAVCPLRTEVIISYASHAVYAMGLYGYQTRIRLSDRDRARPSKRDRDETSAHKRVLPKYLTSMEREVLAVSR